MKSPEEDEISLLFSTLWEYVKVPSGNKVDGRVVLKSAKEEEILYSFPFIFQIALLNEKPKIDETHPPPYSAKRQ